MKKEKYKIKYVNEFDDFIEKYPEYQTITPKVQAIISKCRNTSVKE